MPFLHIGGFWMKNERYLLKVTITSVMIALTCVLTMAVRIPSPTKGYMNLGDCAVLFCGWLLGPVWGTAAGGMGSAFADLLSGYPVYIPGTLIIKAVMAFIVSLLPHFVPNSKKSRLHIGFVIGSLFAEIWMVAGYYLYEALAIGEGFIPALAGVWGNAVQGAVGIAGAYFLVAIFGRTGIIKSIR